MDCNINQQSPVSSEEVKIDLSKQEEIFDFSAPTSTLKSLESQMILTFINYHQSNQSYQSPIIQYISLMTRMVIITSSISNVINIIKYFFMLPT